MLLLVILLCLTTIAMGVVIFFQEEKIKMLKETLRVRHKMVVYQERVIDELRR